MATRERVSDYYASLPGKRIGAGLLCRDADDRVLLVQPTYKPTWELPGGVVEAGESPAACAAREVREELGLDLPIGRLLVVDWLPVRPPKTEGLMMQFDGGVLDDGVTRRFRLPPHELAAWRWFIDYGLGLMNPADGYAQGVGHMGANFGYNSWSACLTEDHLIVVVLTNFDADIFNLARPLVLAARSD